jgi:hypothetical protein
MWPVQLLSVCKEWNKYGKKAVYAGNIVRYEPSDLGRVRELIDLDSTVFDDTGFNSFHETSSVLLL